MSDPELRTEALRESVHATQFTFLRTELEVARNMLNLADDRVDPPARERRRTLAEEACNAVAKFLADDSTGIALSEAEREALNAELWTLTGRLRREA
jgi:hypothetical protein